LLDVAPLLAALGFLIGTVAAMVGIGGGVFIVPALTLIYGFNSHNAVGTSLTVIVFTSLASTYRYFKQRRIDYKVGLASAVTTVPGAFAGAYLTSLISSKMLGVIFAFFLLFVAFRMLFNLNLTGPRTFKTWRGWRRKLVDSDGNVFEYDANIVIGSFLSFLGGLSSGLLGIGGGALIVPILNLVVHLPIHITIATSMFIMIFTSISGVFTHIYLNNVNFEYAACLAIGVIFGAQLGAYTAKRTSAKLLKRIFGVVLIIIDVRLLLKFLL